MSTKSQKFPCVYIYIYIYYVEIDYDSNDERSETVFITLL